MYFQLGKLSDCMFIFWMIKLNISKLDYITHLKKWWPKMATLYNKATSVPNASRIDELLWPQYAYKCFRAKVLNDKHFQMISSSNWQNTDTVLFICMGRKCQTFGYFLNVYCCYRLCICNLFEWYNGNEKYKQWNGSINALHHSKLRHPMCALNGKKLQTEKVILVLEMYDSTPQAYRYLKLKLKLEYIQFISRSQ